MIRALRTQRATSAIGITPAAASTSTTVRMHACFVRTTCAELQLLNLIKIKSPVIRDVPGDQPDCDRLAACTKAGWLCHNAVVLWQNLLRMARG
jgi:hypothetical protein